MRDRVLLYKHKYCRDTAFCTGSPKFNAKNTVMFFNINYNKISGLPALFLGVCEINMQSKEDYEILEIEI